MWWRSYPNLICSRFGPRLPRPGDPRQIFSPASETRPLLRRPLSVPGLFPAGKSPNSISCCSPGHRALVLFSPSSRPRLSPPTLPTRTREKTSQPVRITYFFDTRHTSTPTPAACPGERDALCKLRLTRSHKPCQSTSWRAAIDPFPSLCFLERRLVPTESSLPRILSRLWSRGKLQHQPTTLP